MKSIDVTIVMITWAPTQIRFDLLRNTVVFLRRWTTVPYYMVIVDNGPQEQTQYIREINPDWHIIPHWNIGPGDARNAGAALADTEYLVFIDNDLEFCPGWLESCIKALEKYPECVVTPTRSSPMKTQRNFLSEEDGYEFWAVAPGYCLAMRTETFRDVGPFLPSNVDTIEDREWCNRARDKGHRCVWPPGGFVKHCARKKGFNKKKRLVNGQWVSIPEARRLYLESLHGA